MSTVARSSTRRVPLDRVASIYDVVPMDMNMPRIDGLTATREVCRRIPAERRPRILALTASDLREDRALWAAAGADGWVSKSLPLDIFFDRLDEILENVALYREADEPLD